ncbi:MAG: STAS domain-containing protein [Acidimicrobiales bacterium]
MSISDEGPATVIALRGEVDLATMPLLQDALERVIIDCGGAVIVDLTRTQFIDTATGRAFGRADQALSERGRSLTLRSPSRLTARVLAFLGLSHLVELPKAAGL